jgi:hypothetical protein
VCLIQLFSYALSSDQAQTLWPSYVTVNAFVVGAAPALIQQIVLDVCDDIRSVISNVVRGQTVRVEIYSSTGRLVAYANKYATKIDNGIPRYRADQRNFIFFRVDRFQRVIWVTADEKMQ